MDIKLGVLAKLASSPRIWRFEEEISLDNPIGTREVSKRTEKQVASPSF
jgi:hypothetical protein